MGWAARVFARGPSAGPARDALDGDRAHDFWLLLAVALATLPATLPALALGLTPYSWLLLGGTLAIVVLALLESGGVAPWRHPPRLAGLREWIEKRGILFALTQMPMVALFIGYFFRWTTFPIATAFTVMLAFAALPVWIIARKSRSDDPEEPVHHLARYALYALVPYVVYNLARMPTHYLLQIVFWDHWYDFGSELTGQPVDQYSSLIPGTLVHSLQGYSLALGFYILFKRHSLLNALAYVWIYLSVIYTWTFPTFVLVDYQPPPQWFFVVWWAHLWMALAAWYLPRKLYDPALWRRLRGVARALAVPALALVYVFPFAFVFWRADTWQFPLQHAIDQASFDRVRLVLKEDPALTSADSAVEARYRFTLRFGPRPYKDYINATKALDAGPIRVTGRLMYEGSVVAWCWSFIEELETPNKITNPRQYFPAVLRMEYTDVEVECVGPVSAAKAFSGRPGPVPIVLLWTADVTLVGDREKLERRFGDSQTASLIIPPTARAP